MPRVFVLASDLGPTGPAKQLSLVLPALPRDCVPVEVGVLGERGPALDALAKAGVRVRRFLLRSFLDVAGARALRRAVAASGADVLHAVGPAAVRASAFVKAGPKLVVSGVSFPGDGLLDWLTTRRLRHADRVVAASDAEAARYRALGVAAEKIAVVPPAVVPPDPPPDGAAFRRSIDVPPHARLILAAGRLDPIAGLRDAVWAFDILKYESPDLFLVLCGDGPDRQSLAEFGHALSFDDYRIRFAGPRTDLPELLALAEAVWVTHARGGANVALEAQAAGRPVLGWATADLAAVIRDGETGLLAPHADRVALASKTCSVLTDAALAARLGASSRPWVAERHSPGLAAAALHAVYDAKASIR